ncbi:FmdB family zinc ribbon protein [Sphaerotilus mobilis]|uniref:Putative FmdB family regulatory protein n=1 Tax=Sphaerotilus mobilis TaxID=47994 RepID=A0A4Q7LJP2_9BURK|nr:FmdB family zinc ribbon protein [Sphaerotilus mobilis]RZS54835.1 putative FmdB family regulatory protein [Sphaerotilus mobilis]
MPIYAYRCSACGHAKDVLQKMSDPVLSTCPACGAETFSKQVTAAGFQLKGSGWYATDFRNGGTNTAASTAATAAAAAGTAAAPASASDGSASGATSSAASSTDAGSSSTGSGGATACGGSCACH